MPQTRSPGWILIRKIEGESMDACVWLEETEDLEQTNSYSANSHLSEHAREPGMSAGYWLGVDLGGTKILSGLFDNKLKLLARSKLPTSADSGPASVFGRIVQGV